MKATTAIKHARDYVKLSPMGDQYTLIYYPMPWDEERATRGACLSWPWQQARSHFTTARARAALELMGADNRGDGRLCSDSYVIEMAIEAARSRGATTIEDTVEGALLYLVERGRGA